MLSGRIRVAGTTLTEWLPILRHPFLLSGLSLLQRLNTPKLELEILQTPNPNINPENPTSKLLLPLIRTRNPQLRPHKHRTRNALGRIPHLTHHLARRRNPQHPPLAIDRLPDVPLGVHLEAVGIAVPGVRPEDALVGEGGVVEGEDVLGGGVCEVEGCAVQGPADAVGDDQGGPDGGAGQGGGGWGRGEEEEGAYCGFRWV